MLLTNINSFNIFAKMNEKKSYRQKWEMHTVYCMLYLYCRAHHKMGEGLCEECNELNDYARKQIRYCIFQNKKPVCANCAIHCYGKNKREAIKKIMAWSGPRMLKKYPLLAIQYLIYKYIFRGIIEYKK